MSPAPKAYLDMKYTPDSPLGLTWAGTTSVRDAYTWDPATQVPGVRERDIVGRRGAAVDGDAATRADQDFLAFPRLLGHAEIGWSPRAAGAGALPLAPRGPRAAPGRARRRLLPLARGALAIAAHAGPVIEPRPVSSLAAPGHAPQ